MKTYICAIAACVCLCVLSTPNVAYSQGYSYYGDYGVAPPVFGVQPDIGTPYPTPEIGGYAFNQGVAAMEDGRWLDAAASFELATLANPNSEEAFFFLGLSYVKVHKLPGVVPAQALAEAERALRRALELKPNRPRIRSLLAEVLIRTKRPQEAIPLLEEEMASRKGTEKVEVLNLEGLAYEMEENYELALKFFSDAVEINPYAIDSIFNSGRVYFELRRFPAAIVRFEQCDSLIKEWQKDLGAAEADYPLGKRRADVTEELIEERYGQVEAFVKTGPGWNNLYKVLGDAYLENGDYSDARNSYRSALNRYRYGNTNDVDALTRIGNAYLRQARQDIKDGSKHRASSILNSAVSAFNDAIYMDEGYGPAHEGLGLAYILENQITQTRQALGAEIHSAQEAIRELEFALKVNPDYINGNLSLAEALLQGGEAESALGYYQHAGDIAKEADDRVALERALVGSAKASLTLAKPSDAAEFASDALEVNPASSEAVFLRGQAYAASGNLKEASLDLAKAITRDPTSTGPRVALGDVLRSQSFFSGARDQYQSALSLLPDTTFAETVALRSYLNYAIGECYLEEKDLNRALIFLNEALVHQPGNYQAERALARTYVLLRRNAAAIKAYEIASQLAPTSFDQSDTLAELASFQETIGNLHDAYVNYSKALQLDSTNTRAKEGIGRLENR